MRRRKRGLNDPFPYLPPGCTPSDVDRAMGADRPECPHCGVLGPNGHEDDCDADDGPDYCMVCRPPPDGRIRREYSDSDLSNFPYCDSHDVADFRAKLEHEKQARDAERLRNTVRFGDDNDNE